MALMASLMLAATAAAATAQIPRYDSDAYCKWLVNISSSGSAIVYAGCIDREQTSYGKLKAGWASIAQKTRNYCDEVARAAGGSYFLLDGCIYMETNSAANTPKFKF